jgi:hydroxyacylglutathione hydrolase
MHASLQRLAALPGETRVFCGHEYTENNLRFAASLEPDNEDIARSRERATKLRAEGKPTVGTTLAEEAKHNPFLRVRERGIRERLGVAADADDATAFAAIRAAKDSF